MRYAMALIPLMALGCADQPEFTPPSDHPASAASDLPAPTAVDPFDIEARPIEQTPASHEGHHHGHDQHHAEPMQHDTHKPEENRDMPGHTEGGH